MIKLEEKEKPPPLIIVDFLPYQRGAFLLRLFAFVVVVAKSSALIAKTFEEKVLVSRYQAAVRIPFPTS